MERVTRRCGFLLVTGYWLLVTGFTGCAHVPRDAHDNSPIPLPSELAAYYAYPHKLGNVTQHLVSDQPRFREFFVSFPLAAVDFEPTEPIVEFEWFESKEPGRRAAILFNPILGGDYPLERGICRFFARRGFHVALVHRKTLKISPEHPTDRLELLLRQGVVRIRQVVDWMEQHPRVDPQRLGGFGISMGGIAGVITAAIEPRLRCHVVALAGGSIPDVLMTSKDTLLTKPRDQYLRRNQMDRATMDALLRESVKTDPVRLAPYVDATRLLMFIALFDRTVGRSNALRLWRALGRPAVVWIPLGHYTAYLYLPCLKYQSLKFFQRHLTARQDP